MSKSAVVSKSVATKSGERAKSLPKVSRYVRVFRETPEVMKVAKRDYVRVSGDVTGHIMYIRSEGRFQVDLTHEPTGEARTVYVANVLDGPVHPLDRTVAFRHAIKAARWRTRAQRHAKRVIVRRLPSREHARVDTVAVPE